jgi:hypothetical protein
MRQNPLFPLGANNHEQMNLQWASLLQILASKYSR